MALPTSLIKDIEGTSAQEWAAQADLNWQAEKTPLHYFGNDNVSRESSMVAITRSDTGQELGVVSTQYKIVQPSTILESFEEATHNLGAGFKMDGIGIYQQGKIIWGRAKSDRPIVIKGQDYIDSYLYMVTSFDGSVSTMGFVSTLRTVCSNALHLAQSKGSKLFNVSHRSVYKERTSNALDAYMNTLSNFEESAGVMADTHMNPTEVVKFMSTLLYPSKTEFSEREKTTLTKYTQSALMGHGSNLESVQADETGMSLWGAVNGVTNLIDNNPLRRTGTAEAQSKSAFLGAGNIIKNKAWAQALKMI